MSNYTEVRNSNEILVMKLIERGKKDCPLVDESLFDKYGAPVVVSLLFLGVECHGIETCPGCKNCNFKS